MASQAELQILINAKDEASKVFRQAEKAAGGFGKALTDVGKIAAGFVVGTAITKMTGALGDSIDAFKETKIVAAQLDAVLKSTKNAIGLTADELKNMAGGLEKASLFEDEAIIGAQSLLLTFTNIGKNVFPQATQTVLDMSQALGQDLKSSSIQLGKALNDPIKGITALSRVGVSFTEQQKAQITAMTKAGNVAGAQRLILAELSTEFGGSALAASNAAGASEKLRDRMNDLKEQIGEQLLPIQAKWQEAQLLAIGFISSTAIPALTNLGNTIAAIVGPAFQKVVPIVEGAMVSFQRLVDLFKLGFNGGEIGGQFTAIQNAAFNFGTFLRTTVIPAVNEAKEGFRLFLLTLQGGTTGGSLPAITQAMADLGGQVNTTWNEALKPAFTGIKDILVNDLYPTFMQGVNVEIAAFKVIWAGLGPPIKDVFNFIIDNKEAMVVAIAAIGAAMFLALGPIGQMALAAAGLTLALGELKKQLDSMPDTFNPSKPGGLSQKIPIIGQPLQDLYEALPFRAGGGPVRGGQPYIVGERGPELMVPSSSGTVVPNGAMGGVIHVHLEIDKREIGRVMVDLKNGGALRGSFA